MFVRFTFVKNKMMCLDIVTKYFKMIEFLTLNFLLILITFFVAGFVKGVAGMGLPTIAMGILSIIMSPLSAASLLIIPSFVTNVWQLFTGPKFLDLIKRFWVMMVGIIIGTLAGSWLLTSINTPYSSVGLGLALIIYSVHGLFGKAYSIPTRLESKLSPIIGITTGLLNGATGIFCASCSSIHTSAESFKRRPYTGTWIVIYSFNNRTRNRISEWWCFSDG